MAKLVGGEQFSILTDHLGTPVLMVDGTGARVWGANISVYGELRALEGERHACPFRWPGQYEDLETGLYYNRFRYYDAEAGGYVSQDPIGVDGGVALYAYTRDPLAWVDPLGLAGCRNAQQELRALGPLAGRSAADIEHDLKKRGFKPTAAHSGGTVWTKPMPKGQTAVVRIDPAETRVPRRGYADEVPHVHKEIVPTSAVSNRGNFPHRRARTLDDAGRKTNDPASAHIPIEP